MLGTIIFVAVNLLPTHHFIVFTTFLPLQIAHRPYLDILLRNGLSQIATDSEEFIQFLSRDRDDEDVQRKREEIDALLFEGLGIDPDHWQENLSHSLNFNF